MALGGAAVGRGGNGASAAARKDRLTGEPDPGAYDAASGPEFLVRSVERRGWFSSEVVIAARRSFTRIADGGRRYGYTVPLPYDLEIRIGEGETFRLLLPGRLAEPGRLIPFAEIEENPAFDSLWHGVPPA